MILFENYKTGKMMEITEETKIKDLISEKYELNGISINKDRNILIHCKSKEKPFEDYVREYNYIQSVYKHGDAHIAPTDWLIGGKLGLIWYIIKDKENDPHWEQLIDVIEGIIKDKWWLPDDCSYLDKYTKFFPDYFKQALKKDLNPKIG